MLRRTLKQPLSGIARGWRTCITASLACLSLSFALSARAQQTPLPGADDSQAPQSFPAIAIVIDDLGYRKDAGERAIRLPGPVTLAVLPYREHSQQLAREAVAAGKEVLLHAPMEPRNQVPWEPNGLSGDLSLLELQTALEKMLQVMPQATGINNHMGSKFTEDAGSMAWLMGELKSRQLFFIDSLTTSASLGWQSAQAAGVPAIRRDVFLDNVAEPEAVEKQVQKLVKIAHLRGYALAIGHPHPATLDILEEYLPQLNHLGVELVPASQLIHRAAMRHTQAQKDVSPTP